MLHRMWLTPELCRESEGATPARLALYRDGTAHQGHQARGDRQPQARSAVSPRNRGVLLLERPEDPLLLVPSDSDPGVAHREPQVD